MTPHDRQSRFGPSNPTCEGDDSGFTLIELLVVIVVLGILASIVVFALGGVTAKSVVAACNSDAKTVDIAVATYEAQNPTATQITGGELVAPGGGTLQSWPTSTAYTISISGDRGQVGPPAVPVGPPPGTRLSGDGVRTLANDVVVLVVASGLQFDATRGPAGACTTA